MSRQTTFVSPKWPCIAFSLALLFVAGCDRAEPTSVSVTPPPARAPTSKPQVEWIDPKELKPGPYHRASLTAEQMDRVRKLQSALSEVSNQTIEEWVDNLRRDMHPDREIQIWEAIVNAYTAYCSSRELAIDAKKDVFQVLLLRSMADEQDALKHLNLKVLTKSDAIEIMRSVR